MSRKKKTVSIPVPLSSKEISKLSTALDETTPIVINVQGKDYVVNINKHFRASKLEMIAVKYLEYIQKLRQKLDVTEETIIGTIKLLPTLIIMEFSDVPIDYEIKDIDDLIHVQKNLYDLGILGQVFSQFDKKEVEKVNKMITIIAKEAGKLMNDVVIQKALKEIEDESNTELESVGKSSE